MLVKRFDDFIRENTENKGKGIGGDTDLFPRPTPKQTVDKGDTNPVDNLGIRGRQITTENIDGIVKSVSGSEVFIEDRLSKEIKSYTMKEFLSEFNKAYKKEKKESAEKDSEVSESITIKKEPELVEEDKELLKKILNVNEDSKQLWEKKWESFESNYIKATKEIDIDDTIEEDDKPIKESNIKVENFSNFLNRIKIKLEDDPEDSVVENSVPKQLPQVKCTSCGVEVDDTEADMERHLYSKHNFKPTVDDIDVWLLEYFPPNITED
jgi:hypothetical protein